MKLLLTNFFAPFSAAQESDFSSRFLYHWHSELVHCTCAPMFLAQNAWGFSKQDACGNLVVASLPVNFPFSAFCQRFLRWTSIGLNTIHTFLSHKNPWTDTFLHYLGLSQATQYSPGMESPKGYPNSWIGWLLLVLWQLPCTSLKALVLAFLTTKSFAAGS